MRGNNVTQFAVVVLVCVATCSALPPTIGVASAFGTFIVNSNQVDGNANLFDGSEVKTSRASSQMFLQSGAALTLGIDSAGIIYRDHLLLQQGATKVDNMNGFSVHAANYRIEEGQVATQAVVRLDADVVEVAALAGSLNVFDEKGALLTHIGTGTASAFQTGGSGGGQGSPTANNNNRTKYRTATALLLAVTLAGLGLAVVAIVQPSPTSQ
ncbi:MAG: hypothetical protein M3Y24_10380 [Acidobacteriota bacterium]|nr:hypothetical protein [Acidobacteriota bacterium]